MKATEGLKLVGGSIIVYCIMAACSASSGPASSSTSDGGGSSGGGSGGDGSGSGSLLDALTDPIAEAAADPNQSGTRLKLQYYAGADGSKQSAGMYDSVLKVQCYFRQASDGSTRCMPSAGAYASYYADPGCTQPLAIVACGSPTPTLLAATYVGTSSSQETSATHLFPIASAVTPSGGYQINVSYGDAGAGCASPQPTYTCVPVPATTWMYVLANATAYSMGAELPPTNFVQATLQTEP
jgi:hypothetical protein